MIEYRKGNIFEADTEALVNPVNCVGVMGKGLALQFRKHFPENFKVYVLSCERGLISLGQMFVFRENDCYVVNFPTKQHWRNKSYRVNIKIGLESLINVINQYDIQSVAVPALGCGLGGLQWTEVKPLIETALKPLDIYIIIYEPV